jgi:hypothetical protein
MRKYALLSILALGGCASEMTGGMGMPADEPDAGGAEGGSGGRGTGGAGGSGGGSGGRADAGSAGRGGAGGGGAPDAGGGGGQGSPADAGRTTPDARAPGDAGGGGRGGGAGDGGATPSNPALDQKCTVPVKFTNSVAGSQGGMIFDREIMDAVATMQAHARAVCNILYRSPDEVKNVSMQGLTIDSHDGVAYAAGGNITFSAAYIASYSNNKTRAQIAFELNGVLVHESTHVWQYTNGGGWLVEAMADYVRYKAGFDRLSRRSRGGNWDHPYTTGGFFIHWIEEKYDKDFGYKVNMGMKNRGFNYAAFVQQITGKDVDTVWKEYQDDL